MSLSDAEAPPHAPVLDTEQTVRDLAQILAHRLRGLVASIEGFTDLLADTLLTQDQRDLALRILEGTARIEGILADLQLYGQPVEPVVMTLPVRSITDALQVVQEGDGTGALEVDVESTGGRMLAGDPFLLRQALLVLVQNALDATRHGGRIRVHAHVPEGASTVCLDVWNEGVIKVDAAEQRLFAPFFTTKAQNLGVGLPMARRIAEAHGGSLRLVASEGEGGTCFRLELPLLQA